MTMRTFLVRNLLSVIAGILVLSAVPRAHAQDIMLPGDFPPRVKKRKPKPDVLPDAPNRTPALTIPLNALGYGTPSSTYLGRHYSLFTLDFLDDNRLLFSLRSGGMKRRLTIARSLISEPDVLILDEPTTGLDPQARHLVWERLYRLKSEGVTLVITTHYMDEAEQLCDRLVVMDRGKIVAHGAPRELIEEHSTREVLELRFGLNGPGHTPSVVADLADRVEELPDRLLLYVSDGDEVLAAVHATGLAPESALVRRSTLEDVFLRLTGRTLVD